MLDFFQLAIDFLESLLGRVDQMGLLGLAVVIVASIAVLGWSAEWLVREAVALSERSGVPKVVIGATVVSLGTTAPEVAVSVLAALQGDPDLAMGNAVGSIICDTGLVLGLACLVRPLPLPANIVNRQGWIQFAAGCLLVAASWPWSSPASAFAETSGPTTSSDPQTVTGERQQKIDAEQQAEQAEQQRSSPAGRLPQTAGFLFLVLLVGYLWLSARWARESKDGRELEELEVDVKAPLWLVLGKLFGAVALVIVSSHVLIRAVEALAEHYNVPAAIIAATVVAFGTSLPELVTGVTAARHGHGDLAVGNVVGADVLNALFVAGASAAVTPAGLPVSRNFFVWLFPFMLAILLVFRVGIFFSGEKLSRGFGVMLLGLYLVYVGALVAGTFSKSVPLPGAG